MFKGQKIAKANNLKVFEGKKHKELNRIDNSAKVIYA